MLPDQRRRIVGARGERRRAPPASVARCPARRRGCATSVRSRCGGSHCRRCGARNRLSSQPNSVASDGASRPWRTAKSGSAVDPGVAVPRTGELAVVAAVDPVADQRPQRLGDRAVQLDGQVRDAAARVELVRRDDRAGRTRVEAGGAGAAVRADGRRRRQRQVGVELAQEELGAAVARQQQRVLAPPAEPGLRRQRDLEDRRAVGEDPMAEVADLVADARGEALQPVAQTLW